MFVVSVNNHSISYVKIHWSAELYMELQICLVRPFDMLSLVLDTSSTNLAIWRACFKIEIVVF